MMYRMSHTTRTGGRGAAAAVLCALAAAAAAQDANAPSWPQWLGPARNGVSNETAWRSDFDANGPPVLWKARVGAGFGGISVAGGRACTLGNQDGNDTVTCFGARDGKVLWQNSYACPAIIPRGLINLYPGPRSTPTLAGGMVYTLSRAGHLRCLDAAAGRLLWRRDLRDEPVGIGLPTFGLACSPLAVGRLVVVDVGRIVAVDARSGAVAWQSRKYRQAYSSPVALTVDGRQCVAAFNGDGLAVVDANDGAQVLLHPWRFLFIDNCTTPLVSGQLCFLSTCQHPGSGVVKLAGGKATTVWRNGEMQNLYSNSVLAGGMLFGFHGGLLGPGSLRCVDFATGNWKWTERSVKMGGLIAAGGRLIILSDGGELVVAEASDKGFKPLARAQVLKGACWAPPALAGGLLYCRNHSGDVVCLDLRAAGK